MHLNKVITNLKATCLYYLSSIYPSTYTSGDMIFVTVPTCSSSFLIYLYAENLRLLFDDNTFLQTAAMLPQRVKSRGRVWLLLGIFLLPLLMGALHWSGAGKVMKEALFDTQVITDSGDMDQVNLMDQFPLLHVPLYLVIHLVA